METPGDLLWSDDCVGDSWDPLCAPLFDADMGLGRINDNASSLGAILEDLLLLPPREVMIVQIL